MNWIPSNEPMASSNEHSSQQSEPWSSSVRGSDQLPFLDQYRSELPPADLRALVRGGTSAGADATATSRRRQGIFWMLTVPHQGFTPWLPPTVRWIRGQLETGANGFLHWQVIVGFRKKASMAQVRSVFGPYHAELSRSAAASEYVWKEDTRVGGTQFEIGTKPCDPSAKPDW